MAEHSSLASAAPTDPTHQVDLVWRPLTAADLPAWRRLVTAAALVDRAEENFTEDDLADELGSPNVDPTLDSLAAVTPAGEILAAGTSVARPPGGAFRRYDLWGTVHPGHRGRGLGRRLLAWQLDRAEQRHRADRAPVEGWAGVGLEDHHEDGRRLCVRAGMTPLRWYTGLTRSLADPVEVTPPPAGLRLVRFDPDRSEPVRQAHNQAWLDHWGFAPRPADHWRAWGPGHRNFRPDWSFVAVDAEDVVVGYVVNFAWEQEWEQKGGTEGYTEIVGVVRQWRGRGVASALLTASQAAFRQAGMQYAALDVDADNPTGALRLYRSLGYEPRSRTVLMARRIAPAGTEPPVSAS